MAEASSSKRGGYASASAQARGGWRRAAPNRNNIFSGTQRAIRSTSQQALPSTVPTEADDQDDMMEVERATTPQPRTQGSPGRVHFAARPSPASPAHSPSASSSSRLKPALSRSSQVYAEAQEIDQMLQPHSPSPAPHRLPRRSSAIAVPTLTQRYQTLTVSAHSVLGFYSAIEAEWTSRGTLNAASPGEIERNWQPFDTFKTHQLMEHADYHQGFIDVEDVIRSLPGRKVPRGLEEAIHIANCGVFLHYIWNLPTSPRTQAGPSKIWSFRSGELQDAWRVFLRFIVTREHPLSDEVLGAYLEVSTQAYCATVESLANQIENGEMDPEDAEAEADDALDELLGLDALDSALRLRHLDRSSEDRIRASFASIAARRKGDIAQLIHDSDACRERYLLGDAAALLTRLTIALVRNTEDRLRNSRGPHLLDQLFPPQQPVAKSPRASMTGRSPRARASRQFSPAMSQGSTATSEHSIISDSQLYAVLSVQERMALLHEMLGSPRSERSQDTFSPSPASSYGGSQVSGPSIAGFSVDTQAAVNATRDDFSSSRGYRIPSQGASAVGSGSDLGNIVDQRRVALDLPSTPLGPFAASVRRRTTSAREVEDEAEELLNQLAERQDLAPSDGSQPRLGLGIVAAPELGRLTIQSGKLVRGPLVAGPSRSVNILQPTGRGERLERFDSEEADSDIFFDQRAPARTTYKKKKQRLGGNQAGSRKPPTRQQEPRASPAQEDREATPTPRAVEEAAPRRRPGQPDMQPMLCLRLEPPSEALRAQYRPHLQMVHRQVSPAATPSLTQVQESLGRMTVEPTTGHQDQHDDGYVPPAMDLDDMPAMPSLEVASADPQFQEMERLDDAGAFEGDFDPSLQQQRRQLTLEYWFARVRPGMECLSLPKPTSPMEYTQPRSAHRDAVLQPQRTQPEPDPIESAARNVESDPEWQPSRTGRRETRSTSATRPKGSRSRSRSRARRASSVIEDSDPVETNSSEVDESAPLQPSQLPPISTADTTTTLRNQSQRSNTSRRGRGPSGGTGQRLPWTSTETRCFLRAMYKLARFKYNDHHYRVWSEILSRHGKNGSEDKVLKRFDSAALKRKAEQELKKMISKGDILPYWRKLYFGNMELPGGGGQTREQEEPDEAEMGGLDDNSSGEEEMSEDELEQSDRRDDDDMAQIIDDASRGAVESDEDGDDEGPRPASSALLSRFGSIFGFARRSLGANTHQEADNEDDDDDEDDNATAAAGGRSRRDRRRTLGF